MADGAAHAPRLPQIAEPLERGTLRLRLTHAFGDELAPAHREMELQLGVDFFVDVGSPETQRKAVAKVH